MVTLVQCMDSLRAETDLLDARIYAECQRLYRLFGDVSFSLEAA